jgi:hypothetical protein
MYILRRNEGKLQDLASPERNYVIGAQAQDFFNMVV